jgi:hypothetical protein
MKAAGLLDARPDLPPIGRLRDHLDPDSEVEDDGEDGDEAED